MLSFFPISANVPVILPDTDVPTTTCLTTTSTSEKENTSTHTNGQLEKVQLTSTEDNLSTSSTQKYFARRSNYQSSPTGSPVDSVSRLDFVIDTPIHELVSKSAKNTAKVDIGSTPKSDSPKQNVASNSFNVMTSSLTTVPKFTSKGLSYLMKGILTNFNLLR